MQDTILPRVLAHPSKSSDPVIFMATSVDIVMFFTNIGEGMDLSQEHSEFHHETVIGYHLPNKSSHEISS